MLTFEYTKCWLLIKLYIDLKRLDCDNVSTHVEWNMWKSSHFECIPTCRAYTSLLVSQMVLYKLSCLFKLLYFIFRICIPVHFDAVFILHNIRDF